MSDLTSCWLHSGSFSWSLSALCSCWVMMHSCKQDCADANLLCQWRLHICVMNVFSAMMLWPCNSDSLMYSPSYEHLHGSVRTGVCDQSHIHLCTSHLVSLSHMWGVCMWRPVSYSCFMRFGFNLLDLYRPVCLHVMFSDLSICLL